MFIWHSPWEMSFTTPDPPLEMKITTDKQVSLELCVKPARSGTEPRFRSSALLPKGEMTTVLTDGYSAVTLDGGGASTAASSN